MFLALARLSGLSDPGPFGPTSREASHILLGLPDRSGECDESDRLRQYGSPDVLELQDIDRPVVKDDDVLVRVHAAAVAMCDWLMTRSVPYFVRVMLGLRKPKNSVLGEDVAGQVESVGKNVQQSRPGDEVFGEISGGASAEYVSVPEDALALPPANLAFEQAAAGGGVRTFAVQIAKAFGADRTYELSEVPAAIRHFEEGHARGKIVITVAATE